MVCVCFQHLLCDCFAVLSLVEPFQLKQSCGKVSQFRFTGCCTELIGTFTQRRRNSHGDEICFCHEIQLEVTGGTRVDGGKHGESPAFPWGLLVPVNSVEVQQGNHAEAQWCQCDAQAETTGALCQWRGS